MQAKEEKIQHQMELYLNYIHTLMERQEVGTRYGDTDELIEIYEEKLKIKKKVKKQQMN